MTHTLPRMRIIGLKPFTFNSSNDKELKLSIQKKIISEYKKNCTMKSPCIHKIVIKSIFCNTQAIFYFSKNIKINKTKSEELKISNKF